MTSHHCERGPDAGDDLSQCPPADPRGIPAAPAAPATPAAPGADRGTADFHVVLSGWFPGTRPMRIDADLRYDSADPYAVCLSLHADAARTVDWIFARELLAAGIHRQVGIGDVVVEPIRARHTDHVRITLRTGTKHFHAQLPARTVVSFVQRTESIVRLGAEERHLDLDGLIHRFGSAA